MKIDPSEKQQHIISKKNVEPIDKSGNEHSFEKIFTDTVQKPDKTNAKSFVMRPSMTPIMPITAQPSSSSLESASTHELLDALENYQNLLANPKTTLKMMMPAIDTMSTLSKTAQPLVDKMPKAHPVKKVAQQTLVQIAKEIERFNAGYYVDDE